MKGECMQRIIIIICFLCVTFSMASAETQSKAVKEEKNVNDGEKVKDYQDIVDDFFNLVKDQQFTQAAEGLFTSILVSKSPDISNKSYFDDVKAKLVNLPEVYGKYCNHSRMFERMVAKRFIFIDYIVLFEKQPVEFSFQFYKPKEKWMLYGFTLDTDIVNKMDTKIKEKLLISDTKSKNQ